MKNNKLNDAFSQIDSALIEQAAKPPKKSKRALVIALVAAAAVILTVSLLVPALMKKDDGLPPVSDVPAASDSTSEKTGESSQTANTPSDAALTDRPEPTVVEPPVTPTPSEDPVTDPAEYEVPAWYAPGELNVLSLTLNAKEGSVHARTGAPIRRGANNIDLDLDGNPHGLIDVKYVDLTGVYQSAEHKGHLNLLYDVEKKEVICYTCLVNGLPIDPLKDGERIIIDPMTTYKLVSFAVYNDRTNTISARYIYEPEKELLRKIPLISTQDFGLYSISPDGRYLLTGVIREAFYADFFLINTETLEYKCVTEGYPTFHERFFSPDGQNLLIVLADESGASYIGSDQVRHLMVNVDTGERVICEGTVLSYANGLLITRGPDGYNAYDRTSCTKTDVPEDTYVWEKRNDGIYRINAFTGEETYYMELPDAWKLSKDGLYAYSYVTGNGYLEVRSLENGDWFKVEVSREFSNAVKALSEEYDQIRYSINLNDEGNELLICYSAYGKKPIDVTTPPTPTEPTPTEPTPTEPTTTPSVQESTLYVERMQKTFVLEHNDAKEIELIISSSALMIDYEGNEKHDYLLTINGVCWRYDSTAGLLLNDRSEWYTLSIKGREMLNEIIAAYDAHLLEPKNTFRGIYMAETYTLSDRDAEQIKAIIDISEKRLFDGREYDYNDYFFKLDNEDWWYSYFDGLFINSEHTMMAVLTENAQVLTAGIIMKYVGPVETYAVLAGFEEQNAWILSRNEQQYLNMIVNNYAFLTEHVETHPEYYFDITGKVWYYDNAEGILEEDAFEMDVPYGRQIRLLPGDKENIDELILRYTKQIPVLRVAATGETFRLSYDVYTAIKGMIENYDDLDLLDEDTFDFVFEYNGQEVWKYNSVSGKIPQGDFMITLYESDREKLNEMIRRYYDPAPVEIEPTLSYFETGELIAEMSIDDLERIIVLMDKYAGEPITIEDVPTIISYRISWGENGPAWAYDCETGKVWYKAPAQSGQMDGQFTLTENDKEVLDGILVKYLYAEDDDIVG